MRSGPLPEAAQLQAYENVVPGLASEIVGMAKAAQKAQHKAALIPVRAEGAALILATIGVSYLPWLFAGVAAILVIKGYDVAGIIAGAASLISGGPQIIAATRRPRSTRTRATDKADAAKEQ
ncbi:DUF2335 domain-containing protein [Demequina sp. NBRC 110055]|uniref:DUF2335 domain-containing protein n=1 Tax=Demequina sp. NBRC 110055 TaxID=1570344 RepID=UPI0013566C04|nr:DUF2335 domain-containing protein [Demequina sp. NBRC 110055]